MKGKNDPLIGLGRIILSSDKQHRSNNYPSHAIILRLIKQAD